MNIMNPIPTPCNAGSMAFAAASLVGPQINFAPPDDGGKGDGTGDGDQPYYPEGLDEGLRGETNNQTIDNIFSAHTELMANHASANELYQPDGLNENLRGGTNAETIDKLIKDNAGFREAQGNNGTVPKTPDEYNFELSDSAKAIFDFSDDDKGLKLFKDVLHKEGFTNEAFGAFPKFVDAAIEAGMLKAPVSADEVFASLAPDGFKGGKLEGVAEGAKRVTTVLAHVDTMLGNDKITEGEAKEMKLLVGSTDGVKLLERFMNKIDSNNQPGGEGGGQDITKESLQERMANPKNDRNHADHDKKYAEETRRLYKEFYKDK